MYIKVLCLDLGRPQRRYPNAGRVYHIVQGIDCMQITQGNKQEWMKKGRSSYAKNDWMRAKSKEAQPQGFKVECRNREKDLVSNPILTRDDC